VSDSGDTTRASARAPQVSDDSDGPSDPLQSDALIWSSAVTEPANQNAMPSETPAAIAEVASVSSPAVSTPLSLGARPDNGVFATDPAIQVPPSAGEVAAAPALVAQPARPPARRRRGPVRLQPRANGPRLRLRPAG